MTTASVVAASPATALKTKAQKTTRSNVDTIMFMIAEAAAWKKPPFQRDLSKNKKYWEVVDLIKNDGGCIPGIITLAVLDGVKYVCDGQHRISAFFESGCPVGYSDVRIIYCDDMGEMAKEFKNLNGRISSMKADHNLHAMDEEYPVLKQIQKICQFVGYSKTSTVGMNSIIKAWLNSGSDALTSSFTVSGQSHRLAEIDDDLIDLTTLLKAAHAAWGKDIEYKRLWGELNMTLVMWMYRVLVLSPKATTDRTDRIDMPMFQKCLAEVTSTPAYLDWLFRKKVNVRDISPGVKRIRDIFARRITSETGRKVRLPDINLDLTARRAPAAVQAA